MKKEKKQYIDVELVAAFMKARCVDKKELARRVGVSVPTITRFLSGCDQSKQKSDWVEKLAKAFDIPKNTLIHKDYRE